MPQLPRARVEAHPSRAKPSSLGALEDPESGLEVTAPPGDWGMVPPMQFYLSRVHFLLEEKIFVFLGCIFPFTQIRNQIPPDKPS